MAKSTKTKKVLPQSKPSKQSTKPNTKRAINEQSTPKAARSLSPLPIPSTGPLKRSSKQSACLTLLTRPNGATIEDLQSATGWQSHSIRGFLAGAVKKKLGLTLVSSKADGDVRRYCVVDARASDR